MILFGALYALEHALPTAIRSQDLAYLLAMATGGGLVYVLCFLYLPLTSLQTEQKRWKTKLRLKLRSV